MQTMVHTVRDGLCKPIESVLHEGDYDFRDQSRD